MFFYSKCLLNFTCYTFISMFIFVGSVAISHAQDERGGESQDLTWSVSLGGGVLTAPEFEGSDSNDLRFMPIVELRLDRFFLSTQNGLGVYVVNQEQWKLGAVAKYNRGREESASDLLNGLGDIDPSAELGIFASWNPDPFFVKATALHGTGDIRGFQVQTEVGHATMLNEKVRWTNSVGSTYASERRNETFFGITQEQSRKSGYDAYDADSGFKDIALKTSLGVSLTDDIGLRVFAGYNRLVGPAADSPLVEAGSKNQFTGGCGLVYSFNSGN
ncbi:MipA/OmpV family protein [Desulfovibrio litoralis]|uniref:Outer membrane scaffolding protein for murein synthesis, MipA/OmpV family n=1 Tax=Desulfovibrio litoralis DSM 11393 TaxID=1121455 RepID=A0A1M7T8T8_9BACT|nr:MipA/OmpV family protein [Desulfovibrio litoralis]SHN67113.1 Outer membrane scaffolding protein for murein synthesis, MipA/OmpV family [Desulfovibrio litoralis DSM 11393]